MIHLQAAHLQVEHLQAVTVRTVHLAHHPLPRPPLQHPLEVIRVVQILKVLKDPPRSKTLRRLEQESLVQHHTQMQPRKREMPRR